MEVVTKPDNKGFIGSNTIDVDIPYLEAETIIPVFAKDNESTISHAEFVKAVMEAVQTIYKEEELTDASIKVSHPIKGRIPEAKGKPVKELLDHERTLYYERMAFMIEIPSITASVAGDTVSLTVGGVRAYNHENLYNTKGPEKFKVFIGFKNWVCTNLCVSTDGFTDGLKVQSVHELTERAMLLFEGYRVEEELSKLQELQKMELTQNQFSHFVGRAKQSINLPKEGKNGIHEFPLGDGQLSTMVRSYYEQGLHQKEVISLWEVYNLMTDANKSSYIDSFLNRNVMSLSLCESLSKSLRSGEDSWYLH